jgi:nifR3 family TIM-barrel protein
MCQFAIFDGGRAVAFIRRLWYDSSMEHMMFHKLLFSNPEPPVLLAPMAGATDLVFRKLCRSFGADAAVTEMVSAKALCFGDKKSLLIGEVAPEERPTAVQLFGHESETMARAAALLPGETFDWIDLNMGCPVHKVVSSGDGSALMRDPKRIAEIVRAVVAAVDKPVTVKLRAGIDGVESAPECARAAQEAGASAVTVHARMREQYYAPSADWSVIARVKQAVQIPVFANGDIDSPQAALAVLRETGADGVMIGRAALGNPFLLGQVKAALAGREIPPMPSPCRRLEVAKAHIAALVELKGMRIGMLEARSHMGWYLKGMRGASQLRERCNHLSSLKELDDLIVLALRFQEEASS